MKSARIPLMGVRRKFARGYRGRVLPFLLIHAFLQTRTNELVDSLEMACMKLVNARSAASRGGNR